MRSYVKIYGPPVMKTIKALEKIAVGMPEVCIMDTVIEMSGPMNEDQQIEELASLYFKPLDVPKERCDRIISKSGTKVGEYDFYFEWFRNPSQEELNNLIENIDDALTPLGCKYTITTKQR